MDFKAIEEILSREISRIIPDLRLIEVGLYVENIANNRTANISDIVNSATELYFLPNSLYLAEPCDYQLDWGNTPVINLEMIFDYAGVFIKFMLSLSNKSFNVQIEYVSLSKQAKFETDHLKSITLALNKAQLSHHKSKQSYLC